LGTLRAAFEPLFEAIPALGIILPIAVGSWRVSTGAITIGTLVQFVSLFELLAFPLRLIGFVLSDIPRAVVGRERVQDVFDEPITLPPVVMNTPLPGGPLGVGMRSVSFSYDEHRVLQDVSFEVAPSESVALVGPTGSGKSTLTLLLVRLADPETGSIDLGGVLPDVENGLHLLGVVPERAKLFPTHSGLLPHGRPIPSIGSQVLLAAAALWLLGRSSRREEDRR